MEGLVCVLGLFLLVVVPLCFRMYLRLNAATVLLKNEEALQVAQIKGAAKVVSAHSSTPAPASPVFRVESSARAEPQPSAPAQPRSEAGFCTKCGRSFRSDDMFCGGCGSKRPEEGHRSGAMVPTPAFTADVAGDSNVSLKEGMYWCKCSLFYPASLPKCPSCGRPRAT